MNERVLMLISAGLLIIATICGVLFLVSLIFFIGFGEWFNLPLFLGCFLIFIPLAVLAYRLRKSLRNKQ